MLTIDAAVLRSGSSRLSIERLRVDRVGDDCGRGSPILCEPVSATMRKGLPPSGRARLRCGDEEIHRYSGLAAHARYAVISERAAIAVITH
ncbi:MAG: hypothetical protein AB7G13_25430 [Lautropia sp.]